jgi:hypothetical protein
MSSSSIDACCFCGFADAAGVGGGLFLLFMAEEMTN